MGVVSAVESFTIAEGATRDRTLGIGPSPFSLVTGPSYGTLTFNVDGNYSYTAYRQPTDGFVSSDSFTYNNDENNGPHTVTITITPVNDAPVAYDDAFTINLGDSHSGQVTATDVDGDALTYVVVSAPSEGKLTLNADGSFIYIADGGNIGVQTFTFRANDGLANSNTATVTINIEPNFCGGDGTSATPYLICTPDHLNNVRNHLSNHFRLANDINMDVAPYNTGEGFEPIGASLTRFSGTFDGNNHEIVNLYINRPSTLYIGLFDAVNNAEIFDLSLINVHIVGSHYTGALIGHTGNDLYIDNVFVSGSVSSSNQYTAGLVGRLETGSIINNSGVNVEVNGTYYVGGISGFNDGLVDNSYALGKVNMINPGYMSGRAGGLVGYNQDNGIINNSHSHASVTNIVSNGLTDAGSLVGNNWGIIDNSYATGDVSGRSELGGLVGNNRNAVYNSHATGNVVSTGSSIGGLIGNHNGFDVLNSYATGNVECTNWQCVNVGGLIGRAQSNVNSIINNSYATGNVRGDRYGSSGGVGGFIGLLTGDLIVDFSYSTGNVNSAENAGGFVGLIKSSAIINNSYATGEVEFRTGSTNQRKGGFVGLAEDNAQIHSSYSTGNVINGYTLGGFIGRADDNVIMTDSYSTGNVSGQGTLGGFIGEGRNNLKINNSFTTSFLENATDEYIGGFIGNLLDNTNISNSYWNIDTTGQSTSLGGEGKTTPEMKNIATYLGWNIIFSDNNLNNDYPFLAWQDNRDDVVWLIPQMILFEGGNGTSENPFQISSCEQLQNMNKNLTAYYQLINDIDCGVAPYNIGEGFEPIGNESGFEWGYGYLDAFRGSLDGAGYTISNLYINRPSQFHVGLFGYVSNAVIENVGLVDVEIVGYRYTGALVGGSHLVTINNSFTTGTVNGYMDVGGLIGHLSGSIDVSYSSADVTRTSSSEGSYFGGLVGYAGANGVINNSYATGNIVGRDSNGGFVGYNSGSYIYNSYATGNVTGWRRVGGFAGQQIGSGSYPYTGGRIYNCYATGDVTAQALHSEYTGGFIGNHYSGFIYDSYATGKVNGRDDVGGFVGRNTGEIFNSYSRGNISGVNYVGGFAGRHGKDLTNVFSTGFVSGNSHLGGLVGGFYGGNTITNSYYDNETSGQIDNDGRGEPKTTEEMKQLATFSAWNITNTMVYTNDGYPFLSWEIDENESVWLLPPELEPNNCTLDGIVVLHGENATFYSVTSSTACSANAQVRTCSDGVLDGDDEYVYASCTAITSSGGGSGSITRTQPVVEEEVEQVDVDPLANQRQFMPETMPQQQPTTQPEPQEEIQEQADTQQVATEQLRTQQQELDVGAVGITGAVIATGDLVTSGWFIISLVLVVIAGLAIVVFRRVRR